MNQINSYNTKNNSNTNNNLQTDNYHKKENIFNLYLQDKQNTFSYPILSSYCSNINKQPFNKEEKTNLNKNDFFPKGGGNYINNNSDNNCSSTLEIIEYPISEMQKNKNIIKNDKFKYDKNLQSFKMPLDIKGDSDDDIYLNEEDFKFNKKQSSKISFQNYNSNYNWSKTSSVVNSDLFSDNKNQKKIIFILNNTKKYHQELKSKINNFKKLIYPIKEKNSENKHTYSNNKSKKEINFKFNSSLKENKSQKDNHIKKSSKKDNYLKPKKREYLPISKNININNKTSRDISISNIKLKPNINNTGNISNNSTIKSNDKYDKYSEIYHKKSFKSKGSKNIKNNYKIEIKDNNKKFIYKKNNINSSKVLYTNNLKDNYKINDIKIKNKESKINLQANNTNIDKNKNYFNTNSKDEKNEYIKVKNENKKYIYDLNQIFPYTNQIVNKKNERIRTEKIYINNKIKPYNPFKDDLNKNENKFKKNII